MYVSQTSDMFTQAVLQDNVIMSVNERSICIAGGSERGGGEDGYGRR